MKTIYNVFITTVKNVLYIIIYRKGRVVKGSIRLRYWRSSQIPNAKLGVKAITNVL